VDAASLDRLNEELARTAFQKKVVTKRSSAEVLESATSFFRERGYKSGPTGRPGHVFVMGAGEGGLPRVTAEIAARPDVGKPGSTLVTIDGAGERLGPLLAEFAASLRQRPTPAPEPQ